jgi:hypothetical protein
MPLPNQLSNPFQGAPKKKRGRPPAIPPVQVPEFVLPPEPEFDPEPEQFLPTVEPDLSIPQPEIPHTQDIWHEPPKPPPPPPPVEPRGDPKERVIGKPGDTFTLEEIEYIKAQLKQFTSESDGDPRSAAIINSAIYTDILVQRLDVEMEKLERNRKQDPDVDKKITPLYKRRSQLWDDYCSNLEKLGAMPKDRKTTVRDGALSSTYAKYLDELDKRRAQNWPLGRPSDAAIAMAVQVGDRGPARVPVRQDLLKLDILSDEQRKDFIETEDKL